MIEVRPAHAPQASGAGGGSVSSGLSQSAVNADMSFALRREDRKALYFCGCGDERILGTRRHSRCDGAVEKLSRMVGDFDRCRQNPAAMQGLGGGEPLAQLGGLVRRPFGANFSIPYRTSMRVITLKNSPCSLSFTHWRHRSTSTTP